MNTDAIRETIGIAKDHELRHQHLHQVFAARIDSIHQAIQLPEQNSIDSLVEFVVEYIEHVPNFIDAVHKGGEDLHIGEYVDRLLAVAEAFFLKPPELIHGHIGLDELMDEAYLAHRLIEEFNDRFAARSGYPMIPMDMTMSNLIIHHLIGEPFANELDDAVHHTCEMLEVRETVFNSDAFLERIREERSSGHWDDVWDQWPCLTDTLSITLRFNT